MTIDPAAEFLLTLQPPNLFEPITAQPGGSSDVRCKGCKAVLSLGAREKHFGAHKEAQRRREAIRREKVKAERVKRLALAREAKYAQVG